MLSILRIYSIMSCFRHVYVGVLALNKHRYSSLVVSTELTEFRYPALTCHFLLLQQAEDAKEDFSHLPPNQQRKKLNEKIEQIKQEIIKETAER